MRPDRQAGAGTTGRTGRRGSLCQMRGVRSDRASLDDPAERPLEAVALHRDRRAGGQRRCKPLCLRRRQADDRAVLQQRAVQVAARPCNWALMRPVALSVCCASRGPGEPPAPVSVTVAPVASFLTDMACTTFRAPSASDKAQAPCQR